MLNSLQGFVLLSVITLGIMVVWWAKLRHYGTRRGARRLTSGPRPSRDSSPSHPEQEAQDADVLTTAATDDRSALSAFAQDNTGLLTALSLFAAVTIFALQSGRDIIFRTYLSFSFFTVALVLAGALLKRAVRSMLRTEGFWANLAMTAFCSALLASFIGLSAYWGLAFRSTFDIAPSNWTYWIILPGSLVFIIPLMAIASSIHHRRIARWLPLIAILVFIALGGWLTVFGSEPSGRWISPKENTVVSKNQKLRLSARAYPTNAWDAPVRFVNFTAEINRDWKVLCPEVGLTPGTADTYECEKEISEILGISEIPRDPIRVSFDVYDMRGTYKNAPAGHRHVQIR